MEIEDFKRLGLHLPYPPMQDMNGRSNMELLDALNVAEDAQYTVSREAQPGDDVPRGHFEILKDWSDTEHYAGTYRDIGVYLPPDVVPNEELGLLVCNDGLMYAASDGPVRATGVLDTLIENGDIPRLAAVFVMPGRLTRARSDNPADVAPDDMNQRSVEYDSLTPKYGEFLVNEMLPAIAAEAGVVFTSDPTMRAIAGISSGGICAFNTAWHWPDSFQRVLSHCGSFVNIRGGHNYPYLVRSTARKPIRVYLTSGAKDGNIILGNWPLANQQMASALEFAGYDYHFEFGEGGHSLAHGGALFADALRWLFRTT